MQGHTDKATINQRRPLTPTMVQMLRYIGRSPAVSHSTMTEAEKNATRGLLGRGLITFEIDGCEYKITESGRSVIRERDFPPAAREMK